MASDIQKYVCLEKYLNRFRFLDMRIGGTLADQFILHRAGKLRDPVSRLLMLLAYEFITLFRAIAVRPKGKIDEKYLFTWIGDRPHLNRLILPLIKLFPDSLAVTPVKEKYEFVNPLAVRETATPKASQIFLILRLWFVVVVKLVLNRARLQLGIIDIFNYSIKLLHQLKVVSYWNYRISKSNVQGMVTEFDRNSIAAPLVLTCRKYRIPTITLVHGAMNEYGYAPVIADHILCWGYIQKQQLEQMNVPSCKIQISGNPTITIPAKLKDLPTQFAGAKDKLVIGLGLNPVSDTLNRYFVNLIYQYVEQSGNRVIIKLHPAQRKTQFEWICSSKPNLPIVLYDSRELVNGDFFSMIDCLIVSNSGLGNEALIYGLPVAVMAESNGQVEGNAKLLVEEASCFKISGIADFLKLDSLLKDPEFHKFWMNKNSSFLNGMYELTGNEATNMTGMLVKEIFGTSQNSSLKYV